MHTYEAGDRVRLVKSPNPDRMPNGSIGTVTEDFGPLAEVDLAEIINMGWDDHPSGNGLSVEFDSAPFIEAPVWSSILEPEEEPEEAEEKVA